MLYIDGDWRETGGAEDVPNPATGQVVGRAPVGSAADAADAVQAARRAFDDGPWSRVSARERATRLRAFHAALARRAPDLVSLLIAEAGSTVAAALSHQV